MKAKLLKLISKNVELKTLNRNTQNIRTGRRRRGKNNKGIKNIYHGLVSHK